MKQSRQKKKHSILTFFMVITLLACLMTGGYFAMCRYYENADFICGTWINGVYCAGTTVEEVEQELLSRHTEFSVIIRDYEGNEEQISTAELGEDGYSKSYATALHNISVAQEPGNWIMDTFRSKNYEVTPEYTVRRKNVEEAVGRLKCVMRAGQIKNPSVNIQKTAQGYILQDEKAHYLQRDKVVEVVYNAFLTGQSEISLKESGCYEELSYTETDRDTMRLWEKIDAFQDCKIVYQFGDDKEPVNASVVCDWITLDEERNFVFDKEGKLILTKDAVKNYIASLAEKYDTYGAVRKFQTTRGELVTIEGGTYGHKLNQKAEIKYLTEAFLNGVSEVHEPLYERKAWAQGKNDIGDTYIEIDMGKQIMYYYEKGSCIVQTPIVTGDMMRRRDTPAAVCFVYGKQKNRVLKGPGYAARVKFWMPVKGGIGIHDAAWRNEFGGEIYKTSGSHGCINTPYEAMEVLYDKAEVGTPVVMFY